MSPSAQRDRLERIDGDLVAVRERLTRVEAGMEAHDKGSERRHKEVMDALQELTQRLTKVEERGWKQSVALAVLGVGGGAGGAQLLLGVLGG